MNDLFEYGRELSNNVEQRFRMNTKGKTPTELQIILESLGVKGFVVKVAPRRVTMRVHKDDIKANRVRLQKRKSRTSK